jgi:phosphate:Na+ symporter
MISILGGVGLFLLGMAVMTGGMKALAGSALRVLLAKAAATPLRGAFWGTLVTLLIQSSSASTMTTIGLVSAGLLSFQEGLSLVFGANIGTTGTGWLVALLGVRVSLTAGAFPMIFVGALLKLLGKGRWAGAGAALAGFALVLVGLTTLQEGMSGLAARINPADLPTVLAETGAAWWTSILGVLVLVLAGLVMTTVMQSSTAAIAVTLSALFAGAVGLDQAIALVIGQNVGTATSSAMAAIGATSTAKRLAVAYVLFKLVVAVIALLVFPLTTPWLIRVSHRIDPVTILAAYHTAYNVAGVSILLPMIDRFARLVERLVPERGSVYARYLDPSALGTPAVAVEAARRTVAHVLEVLCASSAEWLESAGKGGAASATPELAAVAEASDALGKTRVFLSDVTEPPASEEEQTRLTNTLFALDYASRLAEVVSEDSQISLASDSPEDQRAAGLCAESMRGALVAAKLVEVPSAESTRPAILQLERGSTELAELRRSHRQATLAAAGSGILNPGEAIARVEAVRRLDRLAYYAWQATAHLVGTPPDHPSPPG